MRHFSALLYMCHWFFVMLYLARDHVVPSGRSPLYVTKSSDEGQIMLPSGRSPLYATKSSDEGQIMLPSGRSPLYETKSSDEGQIMMPSWSKSVVRDKVLRRGANHVGLAGRSPLYVTKSSDKGHDLRGGHSQ